MYIRPDDEVQIREWANKANVEKAEIVRRLVQLALKFKAQVYIDDKHKFGEAMQGENLFLIPKKEETKDDSK